MLQNAGRLTASELAQRLEVSERTVFRDIEVLSGAGVPVYATRGPSGGFGLLDSFEQAVPPCRPDSPRHRAGYVGSGSDWRRRRRSWRW